MSASLATDKYDKLRLLLQAEEFPHTYTHKFIGRDTPAFRAALAQLESDFPVFFVQERASQPGPSGESQYIALTYTLQAKDAEEIVNLLEWTSKIQDLKFML